VGCSGDKESVLVVRSDLIVFLKFFVGSNLGQGTKMSKMSDMSFQDINQRRKLIDIGEISVEILF
jgi:hypothetical protein